MTLRLLVMLGAAGCSSSPDGGRQGAPEGDGPEGVATAADAETARDESAGLDHDPGSPGDLATDGEEVDSAGSALDVADGSDVSDGIAQAATVTVKGQFYGIAVCTPCPGIRPYCRKSSTMVLDEPFFGSQVKAATEPWQVKEIDVFCSDFAPDAGTFDPENETIQWVPASEPCSPNLTVQIRWLGHCVETIAGQAETFEYTLARASVLCCGYHESKPGLDRGNEGITYVRVPKSCGIAGYHYATIDYIGKGDSFLCDDWMGKYPPKNDDEWSSDPPPP